MFKHCKILSPKLHDYSTRTRSWLPAVAATTNQPFGMHFEHVHILASSPCLPPLLGPRFLPAPMWESDFDLGLHKKFHLSMPLDNSFLYIPNVHDAIFWKFVLTFISFATWCSTFVGHLAPLKERWCPHHILCFFYFFVGLLWNSSMVSWACSIFDSFTKMPLWDGNLSTWLSILVLAPLVALIWARPPLQILVHYE